jgi:hypothetical protein
VTEFPEALKKALEELASCIHRGENKRHTWEMLADIDWALNRDELDEPHAEVTYADDFANTFDQAPCPTGTEEYEKLTRNELRTQYIGVASLEDIPGLNKAMPLDPLIKRNPWVDLAFYAEASNLQPFRLDDIQLLGMAAILRNAFDGFPTGVTDEVGAGKTLTTLGVFNAVIRFRQYHNKNQLFPAQNFGKRIFNSYTVVSALDG